MKLAVTLTTVVHGEGAPGILWHVGQYPRLRDHPLQAEHPLGEPSPCSISDRKACRLEPLAQQSEHPSTFVWSVPCVVSVPHS